MLAFDLSHYLTALQISDTQQNYLVEQLTNTANESDLTEINEHLQGERLNQFHKLLIGSRFATEQLCKNPQWFADLLSGNQLDCAWTQQHYLHWFRSDLELNLESFNKQLRQQRNKAMTRIIWRDFNRIANTQETTEDLSAMAEAAIQTTLDYHYHHLCLSLGEPLSEKGAKQPMMIIGMGKLGAWELNLSSDVDLIFAYPEHGYTNANKPISNQEFFNKLGQKIIQSLDQNTADGFVFRVDMRLRPYGQSGALVSNFNALEDYYQTQGREWERFAMIKARIVAQSSPSDSATTNKAHAKTLMSLLRHFTYRGYVDFSAIEALRNLKQLIHREVKRRNLQNNIKLGSGGIREVEFIAQAFQIIRGGRDIQLQNRQLLHILPLLPGLNCLPKGIDQQLMAAYLFLRNTEHAIQGYEDKQTQDLPQDEKTQTRIAFIMGYNNSNDFIEQLQLHRSIIHQQFNAVIASNEKTPEQQSGQNDWKFLWQSLNAPAAEEPERQQDHIEQLAELGFDQAAECLKALRDLLQNPSNVSMTSISRERLDSFMPLLLQQLVDTQQPTQTLIRLCTLITAIARRSAYILLLIENPQALKQLITLSQASPWIANELVQHPALLDELLNPASLYSAPAKQELAQDLQQHMLRIEINDLEAQMEALRYFRNAHSLRVAACEITGKLPLMKISDYLSELAEVICEYSLQLAWQEMTSRYGFPDSEHRAIPNFIIVGYGKLGGIELGHNSDLDLVFLHNASSDGQSSGISTPEDDTPRHCIDNHTFYIRLGQKVIHILSTRTPAGQLYEIDMRLRPSGNSGLLSSSLPAFTKYQENNAWTWEHQALVRARPIAGCPQLMLQFQTIRQHILNQKRDADILQKDVKEMRQKMREQLGSSKKQHNEGLFHLKQDAGGIVDIEFMVQYAVLRWADDTLGSALSQYTDNIRILENLKKAGHLNAEDVDHLINIYKVYRSKGHQLALQQQSSLIEANDLEQERQTVMRIWEQLLGQHIPS